MIGSYREVFDREVPLGIQRRIAKMIVDKYRQANTVASELFEVHEAHDQRGNIRRGLIDQDLRGILSSVPGAAAGAFPNANGSCNHTRGQLGNVVITQSRRNDQWESLPPAEYRDAYVAEHQSYLMPPPDFSRKADGDSVYAVFVHGPRAGDPSIPEFVFVVFPGSDGKHLARLDLFERFPDLKPLKRLAVEIEAIERPAAKLRKSVESDTASKEGGSA